MLLNFNVFMIMIGHNIARDCIIVSEFMQCLIELYKCQERGQANCQQAKGCVLIEPVVTEESVTGEQQGVAGSDSYLPPAGGSVGLGSRPEVGASTGDVSSALPGDTEENSNGVATLTTSKPAHGGAGSSNRKFKTTSKNRENISCIIFNQIMI